MELELPIGSRWLASSAMQQEQSFTERGIRVRGCIHRNRAFHLNQEFLRWPTRLFLCTYRWNSFRMLVRARYNPPKGLSLKYTHPYDTQGLIIERTFYTSDSVNRFTLVIHQSPPSPFQNDSTRDKWNDLYNGVKQEGIRRRSNGGWINEDVNIDNYRMGLF